MFSKKILIATILASLGYDLFSLLVWRWSIFGEMVWKEPSWMLDGLPRALALSLICAFLPAIKNRFTTLLAVTALSAALSYDVSAYKFTAPEKWYLCLQLFLTAAIASFVAGIQPSRRISIDWKRLLGGSGLAAAGLFLCLITSNTIQRPLQGWITEYGSIVDYVQKGLSLSVLYAFIRLSFAEYRSILWVGSVAVLLAVPSGVGSWGRDLLARPLATSLFLLLLWGGHIFATWLGSRPLKTISPH